MSGWTKFRDNILYPALGATAGVLVGLYMPGGGAMLAFKLGLLGAGMGYSAAHWDEWSQVPEMPRLDNTSPTYGYGTPRNVYAQERPVPIVLGKARVGGSVVYQGGSTLVNDFMIAVSEGPVQSITDIRVNDVPAADVQEARFAVYLGTAAQDADTRFVTGLRTQTVGLDVWELGRDGLNPATPPAQTVAFDVLEDGATVRLNLQAQLAQTDIDTGGKGLFFTVYYKHSGDVDWTNAGNHVIRLAKREMGFADAEIPVGYVSGTQSASIGADYLWEQQYSIDVDTGMRTVVSVRVTNPNTIEIATDIQVHPFPAGTGHQIKVEYTGHDYDGADGDIVAGSLQWKSLTIEERYGQQAFRHTAYIAATIPASKTNTNTPTITSLVEGWNRIRYWDASVSAWAVGYSRNPVWQIRALLTGPMHNTDPAAPVYRASAGLGLTDAQIDDESFKAAAALCDELVGGEPRFTFNGVLDVIEDDGAEHIRTLLAHCRGLLWIDEGRVHVRVEAPAAVAQQIDVADMVEGSFEAWHESDADIPDALIVRYIDPDQGWEKRGFVIGDPGGRTQSREWLGCTSKAQAERLGYYVLNAARRTGRCRFSTPLGTIALEPGDVVEVFHPAGPFGYDITDPNAPVKHASGAKFIITGISDSDGDVRSYECREYDEAIYSDDPGLTDPLPVTSPVPNPFEVPAPVENLTLTYLGDITDDGVWNPEILAEWTHPYPAAVAGYELYTSPDGAEWTMEAYVPAGTRYQWKVPGPSGVVYVRVVPRGIGGKRGSWSAAPVSSVATTADTTPPAVPTGLVTRFTDRVVCSWTRGTDPDLSHYLVSVDGGVEWTPTADTSIEIVNPDTRSYTFQVKAVDRSGNASSPAQATATKPEPPAPAAAEIRVESSGLTVTVTVTSAYTPADGHRGFIFEYRYAGDVSWVALNDLPSDVVAWSAPQAGTIEVRAMAVDQIGTSTLATDPPATAVLTLLDATDVAYADGTPLENLKPAEAGADVTGANTAADTAKVSGTAAATVKSQAADGSLAYSGTVLYRTAGVPTNAPVPSAITTEMGPGGMLRVTLEWSYTQGAKQADVIVVFARKSSLAPVLGNDVAVLSAESPNFVHVIDGLDPDATWSFGVAAGRRTEYGLEVGAIQSPTAAPDWVGVTLGTPDYTGNVTGTPATTVVSNATDGKTAHDGTVLYRTAGAPTNAPVPNGLSSIVGDDGSYSVTPSWAAYTQGAKQADLLLVYWESDPTAAPVPTTASPCVAVDPATTSYTFLGLAPDLHYSFGIAAARRTENGLEVGAIQSPTATPDWQDISYGAPNWQGNIAATPATTVRDRADTGWELTWDNATVIHPSSVAAVDLGSGQVGTDPLTNVRDTASEAHSGTVSYRTVGVPTNNPTPSAIALTANPDGSYDITISWAAYTQGARQADVLGVFWRSSTSAPGTPTYSDRLAECPLRAGYGGSFTLAGAEPSKFYSFAIAAGRRTENGVEWGALQAPTSAPDWIDVQPASEPDFQGTVGGVDAGQVAAYTETNSTAQSFAVYSGQDLLDAIAVLPRNLTYDATVYVYGDITLPSRCLIEDLHGTGKLYIRSNDPATNRIITCPGADDGIVVRSCTLPIELWFLGWHVLGSSRAGLYVQDNPGHVYVYDAQFSRDAAATNTYGIRARRSPTVWASSCTDRAGYDLVHYGLYADVAAIIFHSSAAFGAINYQANVGLITGGVVNPT